MLDAKWDSATMVLADPSSAGASYIDVSDPSRPAAGVSEAAVAAAGLITTGNSSATGVSDATLGSDGSGATESSGASASSNDSASP